MVGANDGVARVYTRDPTRIAPAAILEAFAADVAATVEARSSGKVLEL